MSESKLDLSIRRQSLRVKDGYKTWETETKLLQVPTSETALLLCDVWDSHWCRGARDRLNSMIDRMNLVTEASRARGIQIIHAPSGTMSFYEHSEARKRTQSIPNMEPPLDLDHEDPPLPIDDSEDGSDTGEDTTVATWTRQHPSIRIDETRDAISDDGREVYNLLRNKGIDKLLIMGVHTNMCVLGRSFAIKQMVRWGLHVALVRDLTDAMYNPEMAPYVSHEEGTNLVIEFIEKFWCPTITSTQLLPAVDDT